MNTCIWLRPMLSNGHYGYDSLSPFRMTESTQHHLGGQSPLYHRIDDAAVIPLSTLR